MSRLSRWALALALTLVVVVVEVVEVALPADEEDAAVVAAAPLSAISSTPDVRISRGKYAMRRAARRVRADFATDGRRVGEDPATSRGRAPASSSAP